MVSEISKHLKCRIIPFWENLRDDTHGGYYSYLDYDLTLDKLAPKGIILNSRILWFFSSAYTVLQDPALLDCATHAFDFMPTFEDKENGGFFWSCTYDGKVLDETKHTYAQAFAVYGLCAYAKASGLSQPLEMAMSLYDMIESKMVDEVGYMEAFGRNFVPLSNEKLCDNPALIASGIVAEKTMNTLLHVLEAYTLLYEITKDERVKDSVHKLLKTMVDKVYNAEHNRLEVFFDKDMNSVFDMQSYGHDIEATWLIDLALECDLDEKEREAIRALTTQIAWGVYDRALTSDGFINEIVKDEKDLTRVWWVQAEAMVGYANLFEKTGDVRALDAVRSLWTYVKDYMVDSRSGSEWFSQVDDQGIPSHKPIVELWKCPYHNGRMCLEIIKRAQSPKDKYSLIQAK